MAETAPGFGLYVHWPFCAQKCPYCDFNVHIRTAVDQDLWADALCTELRAQAARLYGRPKLRSVHFGGGTPSLMAPAAVSRVVAEAERLFGFEPQPEIGLEANPADAGEALFAEFAAAGVNRLSLGVQAFDDAALSALGRSHTSAQAEASVAAAKAVFPNVSFDLIAAREGQTPRAWEAELARALSLGPQHLSVYALTIEPGTAFAARVRAGVLAPPGADDVAALMDVTEALTAAAGFAHYEVSNYALPGFQSRQNRIYWEGGFYLGIGPGAHGRAPRGGRRVATTNRRKPESYLADVAATGLALADEEILSERAIAEERVLMGLRLSEGVAVAGLGLDMARIAPLVDEGLVTFDGLRLAATPRGRRVLDAVTAALLV